jgi:hypothetical protein
MRSTDRDYFMSTISVLQYQRLMLQSFADDMCIRLDELENQIAMQFEQKEDETLDIIADDAWQSGYDYRMWEEERDIFEEENDKIIYDTLLKDKVKYCTCDTCWDVKDPCEDARPDQYEHRMD